MNIIFRIARKEFAGFFSSSIGFIFLGAFLAITLFIFFWVETFFSRNIADVRPLFDWMPLLLIFLVSSITMRMWSEERRSGTLEFLLTAPVKSIDMVMGKFFACLGLVVVALLLTLPLPITVSLLGPLDWGPVFGGYLATVFLASSYTAIGLFISVRSTNQIVSLILTAAVCGFFYLLGTDALTGLFDNKASESLKLLGTGSRFESITRGVIDLRDLYYYLSLVGVFLVLNVFSLEWLRWAGNAANPNHRRWLGITVLMVSNFLAANLWLAPVTTIRGDLTQGSIYSISEVTRRYLAQLREPLLIRGYFSNQTHPLLAPLVPRLLDLLKEYAVAGEGKLRVEFIDPEEHPKLEREANEKYGIKPVPFQFASKYQATVVNSYFNILIQYGDQHEVLSFGDLIEVKTQSEADLEIELRNPEYDITQSIKKVLYAYQGAGQLFENIPREVRVKGYISANEKLPEILKTLSNDLDGILTQLVERSDGKLVVDIRDPDAEGGALAERIKRELGFKPMVASLLDTNKFWFYLTLESGDGPIVQVPLPEDFEKAALERGIQAALKRFSTGFLKTVALHTPAQPRDRFGREVGGKRFHWLRDTLLEEFKITAADLKNGRVPDEAELLLLAAPAPLDQKQLFAVDQFLMRGGTVIMATSPFDIDNSNGLSAHQQDSDLLDWLSHHGITLEKNIVLDPQNASFPMPFVRRVSGLDFKETRMVNYPYFSDVRGDGIGEEGGLTSGINQVTMTWPSPIILDAQKNQGRQLLRLLESSDQAWTSDNVVMQPDYQAYGEMGFAESDQRGKQLLAVAVEGRFDSYFKGKSSPLATKQDEGVAKKETLYTRVIDRSPDSARIIVFASSTFLTDTMLDLAASGMGTRYLKPIELVENAIDWSMEDRGLLSIRGRAHFSSTLNPMDKESQMFWEYLNYVLALAGLLLIGLLRWQANKRAAKRYAAILGASLNRQGV